MTLWLENRVAIVTGSGQGIGKAIAVDMAKAGAKVVTNNRKPGTPGGDAETTAKEITDMGGQAVPFFGDVSEWEVAQKLVQTTVNNFGRLDILVNNAAIAMEKSFMDTTKEDFDALVDNNLKGPFNCLQAALPHMKAQKYGRIINISSGSGLGIVKGEVAYGATKAGVLCLTKGIALELRDYGITLNAIMPVAMTRMQEFALTKVAAGIVKAPPGVGRHQPPETISPIVVYLAAENAEFGQPEINLGIMPGNGGTQRLPRLVGEGRAMEMILTGDLIDAQEAYRIGLVNRVVSQAELMPYVKELAKKLAVKAPLALKLAKDAVHSGLNMSLGEGIEYENKLFAILCGSEDKQEGVKAFLEKRSPSFKGR